MPKLKWTKCGCDQCQQGPASNWQAHCGDYRLDCYPDGPNWSIDTKGPSGCSFTVETSREQYRAGVDIVTLMEDCEAAARKRCLGALGQLDG